MSTSRPFAYNTGTTLPYTEQVGDIAVGVGEVRYDENYGGLQWWNGPDEDLGYVIAHTVPSGNQPNPLNIPAYMGFWRSPLLTEQSFVDYTNFIFGTSFSTGFECKTYLNNNGYWTSYGANLRLFLDASNPNSYSGSGIIWYDLSGNGNHVTMQNPSSINWVNSGAVYFLTGTDGWFYNPSGNNLPIGNSNYTFIIWVQLDTNWAANGFMSIGPFGAYNLSNAFRAGITNQLINYWWGNDLSVFTSLSPTNGWFNAVAKYDGITRSIFVNGVLVGSDTPVGHNVITSELQIAKTTSTEYLQGKVAEVLIYDVALSNSDIVQYYNNTFSRYIEPTPTPTPTVTVTPTLTETPTNTPSVTPTITTTPTYTITPTKTVTPTLTPTPTNTITVTPTITLTPSTSPPPSSAVTFSRTFTSGLAPGTTIETAWTTFRSQLTGTYTKFDFTSSNGQGYTGITDAVKVQQIADAIRTGTTGVNFSTVISGVTWNVGCCACRSGGALNGAVEFANVALCSGSSTAALRPWINNSNWGGIGSTVGASTQTLTLKFY